MLLHIVLLMSLSTILLNELGLYFSTHGMANVEDDMKLLIYVYDCHIPILIVIYNQDVYRDTLGANIPKFSLEITLLLVDFSFRFT